MYQLVIMDDVEEAALAARAAVEASPFSEQFVVAQVDGADGLAKILVEGRSVDVLIADIRLGVSPATEIAGSLGRAVGDDCLAANGIHVVRELLGHESATQVIYLTGYIEYCTKVYETDHAYFLTKPICQEDFDKALARAVERLERAAVEALSVKSGHAVSMVPFRDIAFIESRLRKLEIHVGDAVHTTYGTISEIAGSLPAEFVRTHKSFVVNLHHVIRWEPDGFVLRSGERVPASKRCKQKAREAFFAHLGR